MIVEGGGAASRCVVLLVLQGSKLGLLGTDHL